MTKTLFALHRTLWARSMKSNPAQIMVTVLILLYGGIGLSSLGFMAAFDLHEGTHNPHAVTAGAAVGMLAYVVLAIAMPSGEKQLTAQSLATLPVRAKVVIPALAISAVFTTRSLLCVVFSVVYAIVGMNVLHAAGSVGALLVFGMALACVTTILLGECVAQLGTMVVSVKSDKAKAALGVLGVLLMFGVLNLQSHIDQSIPLGTYGSVAAWTPLGAASGWALSVANHNLGAAAAQLAIALISIGALAAWWRMVITRQLAAPALESGDDGSARSSGVRKLELGRWSYSSPAAMEYTRSLRYFTRDSRMVGNLIMMPLFACFTLWQAWKGEDWMAYFLLVFFGILVGLTASNDFGFDGPANWVKLASPVPPQSLYRARHWAMITPLVAIQLLTAVVVIALARNHVYACVAAVVAVGMLLSSAAIGLSLSAFNAYPVSPPGTNPWQDKSGFSAGAFIAALAGMFLGWFPLIPGLIIAVMGKDSVALLFLGAAVALLVPAVLYGVALHVCSRHVARHMPDIYAKVCRYAH